MQHDNIQKSTAYLKSNYNSRKSGATLSKGQKRTIGISVVVIILLIAFFCLLGNTPRNYYMKNLFVSEAMIVQTSAGDSGSEYAIQVQLNNPAQNISLDSDNTWVSVNKDFYAAHSVGQKIGVLVCNYDVYTERYFGIFGKQGQDFEKDTWSIDDVYGSLAEAETAFPHSQFSEKATLKSKTKLDDGSCYFVLDYQGREMTNPVDENQYSRYNLGDSVSCKFDGYGDFIRVVSID
jgi:hypothetical protein